MSHCRLFYYPFRDLLKILIALLFNHLSYTPIYILNALYCIEKIVAAIGAPLHS